jgi:hypothetical protein
MKFIQYTLIFAFLALLTSRIYPTDYTYGYLEQINIAKASSENGPFYYVQIQTTDTGHNPCIKKIPNYIPICRGGEDDCAPIGCSPFVIAPSPNSDTEVELDGFVFPYKTRANGVIKITVLNSDGTEKNIVYLQDKDKDGQGLLCSKKQTPGEKVDLNVGWDNCWLKKELTDTLITANVDQKGEITFEVTSVIPKKHNCSGNAECWLKDQAETVGKGFNTFESVLSKTVKNSFNKLFLGRPHHNYCRFSTAKLLNPPTIDSDQAKKADTDGLLKYIQKYSPIAWIEGTEDYYPMTFSEYITAPSTSVINQDKNDLTVVPANQITMEGLYGMHLDYKKNPHKYHIRQDLRESKSHALKIDTCTTWGADPAMHTDSNGNLTTPIYAITFEQNNKLYIQYLFFYGFNGPYDVLFLKGDIIPDQDAHEGDLEHMTMELNKDTKQLERIYYSSHGTKEGFWLNPNQVEFEGTHPVAYIAHYSHAIYPKEGTYVRIRGIGNDITTQGQKWYPQVMRLYPENDKRFDPKTMGFMYFPGYYGERGVGAVASQGWFMNPAGGDIGRDYKPRKWFCKNPPHRSGIEKIAEAVDWIPYQACVIEGIFNAPIPD